MSGQNLVAVYPSRGVAETVRDRLIEAGIVPSDIRLSEDGTARAAVSSVPDRENEGWFGWLFGRDVPAEDRSWYAANLDEGRVAVSVYLRGGERERVQDIMEEAGPIDVDAEHAAPLAGGTATATSTAAGTAAREPVREPGHGAEEVIPVTREELDIGKRETERRYRVRSYIVEHPVDEAVHLRDERVVIERRPVAEGAEPGDLQEHEVEVVERREEPVVAKRARKTEEVAVHKDTRDRVEHVHDTVRETKVDVEKPERERRIEADRAAAGNKPTVPPVPSERIGEGAARDAGALKTEAPPPIHDPKI